MDRCQIATTIACLIAAAAIALAQPRLLKGEAPLLAGRMTIPTFLIAAVVLIAVLLPMH
jgi:hypothetical protein